VKIDHKEPSNTFFLLVKKQTFFESQQSNHSMQEIDAEKNMPVCSKMSTKKKLNGKMLD
jgi:hypothetical protein